MYEIIFGLLGAIFIIIIAPILMGMCIASLIGAVGGLFYGIIILVSLIIWTIFGVIIWI